MLSEAYGEFKDKESIELKYNTDKYISFTSHGSWRMDSYEKIENKY